MTEWLLTILTWYSVASCQQEGNLGTVTASGKPFSDTAMICAHPTLPFGTQLELSANEKLAACTVWDRGPGRGPQRRGVGLDASPAVFRQLAPLAQGRLSIRYRVVRKPH
mgnify:CR=1 FL=1